MSDASTLLRLDSMTLRGVGSYFHGAELKVRPLTILCGTNGSGKSTWFNAIELLQRSLSKGMLPFGFDADDGDCHDMQWTNARVNSAALPDLVEDATTADRFGPWGTIGASSTAVGDVRGSQQDGSWRVHDHVAARLLWLGVCVKGDRFRLRLAHSS